MQTKVKKATIATNNIVASRLDDPWLAALWTRLPNPDPILRRQGGTQDIFDRLLGDAHIVGELRAVRAGLLGYEWRIMPGGDNRAARRATDLARAVMDAPPAADSTWQDVIWTMALATFRGYAVHDVQWARFGADILPAQIIDRPQRRFVFAADDNALRVLTNRDAVNGAPIAPRQTLLTRHMPTFDNPYGVAVFSSCFWPYTFKHAGFKFFTQFCDKFGVPFIAAKHPAGWDDDKVKQLVEALAALANNAVGAVEDGVDMMPVGGGGGGGTGTSAATPQERLIRACNMELSKALTSQTLATEVQGQGSRAAADTHLQREQSVHVSDRAMISSTLNMLFRWITDINLGAHVPAPTHHFYEQDEAREDWGRLISQARTWRLPIKAEEVYERVGLTPPAPGDDLLPAPTHTDPRADPRADPDAINMSRCPGCGQAYNFRAPADPAADPLLAALDAALAGDLDAASPATALISQAAADPEQLTELLQTRYPDIDATALQHLLAKVLFLADLLGAAAPPEVDA